MSQGNKMPQVLKLEPQQEIVLRGPFDKYVEAQLKIANPLEDKEVYYKVKTTAPKFYCVRPNSGVVKAREQTVVKIILQPTELDDLVKEKARHKFMIQSYIPQSEREKEIPVEQIWKEVDQTKVMDTKLKVSFVSESGEPLETIEQFVGQMSSPKTPSTTLMASPQSFRGNADFENLQNELQRQRELCQMYQDEKKNLEKENMLITKKYEQLSRAQSFGSAPDGFSQIHVILFAIFALIMGFVLGKVFF